MSLQSRMIRLMSGMNSIYIQPGFKFNTGLFKPKSYYDPTKATFTFVNGYVRTYNPALCTMNEMLAQIKEINTLIEFERSYNGQDDELDDDV